MRCFKVKIRGSLCVCFGTAIVESCMSWQVTGKHLYGQTSMAGEAGDRHVMHCTQHRVVE